MTVCNVHQEMAGFFKMVARKASGESRIVADWQKNLILDSGLNRIATQGVYVTQCQVGSGSTAPEASQTSLVSRIAGVSRASSTVAISGSAPYYIYDRSVYSFGEGEAAGNLSEVGFGWSATASGSLFSRALIKDPSGAPTTITILPDEYLDVIYELRVYAPASDVTGTITATGDIGGTYAYTLRASTLADSPGVNAWSMTSQSARRGAGNNQVKSGDIGPVTGIPSGTSNNVSADNASAYVAGTFYLDRVQTVPPTAGNFATGLRSMDMKLGVGCYQIQFEPAIPKTSNDLVQLTIRLSWSRRT